jgi:hypothetical protein
LQQHDEISPVFELSSMSITDTPIILVTEYAEGSYKPVDMQLASLGVYNKKGQASACPMHHLLKG